MKEFVNALSNSVWLNDEGRVEKRYSTDSFKKHFGNQEWKVIEKLGYDYELKDNKLLMEFIENEPFDDNNITNDDLIKVAAALKYLHSLPTEGIEVSKFEEVYFDFLAEDEEITENYPIDGFEDLLANEAIDILLSGEQVILHNDVVEGNLLKVNDSIKLIDFEYSGLGNRLFDIASFLTERDLTEEQKEFFINQFDNVNREELITVCKFLQIFWARWALYKYDMNRRDIYKDIADWKFEQYLILNKK